MLKPFLKISSVLTILIFCCGTFILNSCTTDEEIKTTIIELEKKALDRWADGMPSEFVFNFDASATYFDDISAQKGLQGIEELEPYFASLDGMVPKHTYELINPKVQVFGDIAILTMWYQGTMDGQLLPPWKATSVYHFKDDVWKVVHANWSMTEQAEPNDQEQNNF